MRRSSRDKVPCSVCGEPRLVFGRAAKGNPVCRPCIDHLNVEEAVACRKRAWFQQVQDLVQACCTQIDQGWVRLMFSHFVARELERQDARLVVRRLPRHLRFFQVLDTTFANCLDVTATGLLSRCDAQMLKHSRVYLEFLKEIGYTVPSREAIADLRVTRSADRLLAQRQDHRSYAVLLAYHAELNRRHLRSRTIHRLITIAFEFLQYLHDRDPCEELIDTYVRQMPTHRIGLGAFTEFLQGGRRAI
ncbi:hypothetical protein C3942_16990 [Solimonas fluminis]|jgi:hypothetical protein|uniref:Uncharacterized protein n=1 Tax=Solimonas fluminis TaxID=2086571 RepID=A0A2S5TCQ5_9GAMM|nr:MULTISPECIES: hypothetical protein [Solimonas]MDM4771367.1 hypothetical protein [Solimonas sp. SE-A11]PPE72745.1 hypothetical protein C3942_16990 [Solimonas fluminis]